MVRRQSGSEAVHDVLRQQIISGALAPGDRLTELDLAANLGVSRTPIREALRLLLGEQLVERRATGGFRVAPLYTADVRGIYDVRALLEGLMAQDACQRMTEADLTTLRRQIERMSLLRDHEDEVVKLGREFHGQIEQLGSNRWCVQLLQQIRGHIDRFRTVSTRAPGRAAEAAEEHQKIYDALASGDADAAGEAMREHVYRSAESTLKALTDSAQPGQAQGAQG